ITNKPRRFAEPLLREMGILDFFTAIVGGDCLPEKKPNPEPLLHAITLLDSDPEHALYVGDSETDVRAARAAGLTVICVTYGYNHGRDIRAAKPDAVIDSLAQLPGLFAQTA
ncbi:MAG: phosphoglycolate phosphatase, partial [Gammaproteobacteria bacterium]